MNFYEYHSYNREKNSFGKPKHTALGFFCFVLFLVINAKPTLNSVKGKCVWKANMAVGWSRCECSSGTARNGSVILYLCERYHSSYCKPSFLHMAGNAVLMSSELLVSTTERKWALCSVVPRSWIPKICYNGSQWIKCPSLPSCCAQGMVLLYHCPSLWPISILWPISVPGARFYQKSLNNRLRNDCPLPPTPFCYELIFPWRSGGQDRTFWVCGLISVLREGQGKAGSREVARIGLSIISLRNNEWTCPTCPCAGGKIPQSLQRAYGSTHAGCTEEVAYVAVTTSLPEDLPSLPYKQGEIDLLKNDAFS